MHTQTHLLTRVYLHALLSSHKPYSSWSIFPPEYILSTRTKGTLESRKVIFPLNITMVVFLSKNTSCPIPTFVSFFLFLLSFSGHYAKHVRQWPTLSIHYNLLKPLPFRTNVFVYGIFYKNYLKKLCREEVKLWENGLSILKILGCKDQELSMFQ